MKLFKLMIFFMVLVGCTGPGERPDISDRTTPVFVNDIEERLSALELDVGLGVVQNKEQVLEELADLLVQSSLSDGQIARIHSLKHLLSDSLLETTVTVGQIGEDYPSFTGSDAVAIVFNHFGEPDDGYEFVYEVVPVTIGIDGTGFYVSLVPVERDVDTSEPLRLFLVSQTGEILVFN